MTLVEDRNKKKKAQAEARAKRDKDIRNVITVACAKSEGIQLMRYLMEICGYQKIDTVMNPATGEINPIASMYNQARRNVYVELRRLIPKRILTKIEHGSV